MGGLEQKLSPELSHPGLESVFLDGEGLARHGCGMAGRTVGPLQRRGRAGLAGGGPATPSSGSISSSGAAMEEPTSKLPGQCDVHVQK